MSETSQESRIRELEKNQDLLDQKLDHKLESIEKTTVRTDKQILILSDQFKMFYEAMNSNKNTEFEVKACRESIKKIENERIKPMEDTIKKIDGIGFVVKNFSAAMVIVGVIAATVVYSMK